MKALKVVGIALLIVIAVTGFLGYRLWSNLDSMVLDMIETQGSMAAGVPVKASDFQLDLASGRATLGGLTVANPPGYSNAPLFSLQNVAVQLDLASLTGPVIVIQEVSVDGATVNTEQNGTRSNLTDLLRSLKSEAGSAPADADSGPTDVRLMIEQFAVTNTLATLDSAALGSSEIRLPDIRERNIGDRQQGLSPDAMATTLMQAVIGQVQDSVEGYAVDRAKQEASERLEDEARERFGDKAGDAVKGLQGMLKGK